MKNIILILFMLGSLTLKATEQVPDILIYKNDTIYFDNFPLEKLRQIDSLIPSRLYDPSYASTGCSRQYRATWKIENDSLFLITLIDCYRLKKIPLEKVFCKKDIKNSRVFAYWYSESFNVGFGKIIRHEIFEKNIELDIKNGIIAKIQLTRKE